MERKARIISPENEESDLTVGKGRSMLGRTMALAWKGVPPIIDLWLRTRRFRF